MARGPCGSVGVRGGAKPWEQVGRTGRRLAAGSLFPPVFNNVMVSCRKKDEMGIEEGEMLCQALQTKGEAEWQLDIV